MVIYLNRKNKRLFLINLYLDDEKKEYESETEKKHDLLESEPKVIYSYIYI